MSEETPSIAVIFENYEPATLKPKVTLWHWVKYYAFNLYRKPLVIKRQKELKQIFNYIQKALQVEVYPLLLKNKNCTSCRDTYLALKPQVFLSQIEIILRRMGCFVHPDICTLFLLNHSDKFRQSEQIAKWINNL